MKGKSKFFFKHLSHVPINLYSINPDITKDALFHLLLDGSVRVASWSSQVFSCILDPTQRLWLESRREPTCLCWRHGGSFDRSCHSSDFSNFERQ